MAAKSAAIAALVIEAVSTVPFSSSIAAREPMTSEPAMPSAGRALEGIERGREVVGGNDLARADRARDDERLLARLRSGAKRAESQGRSGAEAQGDHEMTVPP